MLAYPFGIYQYIFLTALFIHPTHIYTGFYYEMNHCAYMGIALYATSLMYWINPTMHSSRRTLDMIVAKSSILYHFYLSFYTEKHMLTFLPIAMGSGLYYMSFYLVKLKYIKIAAFCHCMLHAFVSFGASMTYMDYYKKKTLCFSPLPIEKANYSRFGFM